MGLFREGLDGFGGTRDKALGVLVGVIWGAGSCKNGHTIWGWVVGLMYGRASFRLPIFSSSILKKKNLIN